jgi:hypothetical protein
MKKSSDGLPENNFFDCSDSLALTEKIQDCNEDRDDQQQMDQASCHVKRPSQEPENDEYGNDCPKHTASPQDRLMLGLP